MTDLSGRRAVVTGGASGIGEACVRAFAAAGADIVIADLNGDAAARVADEVGGVVWQVDLGDTAALADLTFEADILVNNAGIQHVRPLEDFEPERFSLILRLMLESPFLLIRAALPGAAITEKVSDETYNGTITLKVGPVSAKYRGTMRFESLDPAARTAR